MATPSGPPPAFPPLNVDTTDQLLGSVPAADVAEALCVRRKTLVDWRRRGVGPPSFKPGHLLTLYPIELLHRWWESPSAARTRRRVQMRSAL